MTQKELALEVAIKALKYCAIEPGLLHAMNNRQNVVALNALAEIDVLLRD